MSNTLYVLAAAYDSVDEALSDYDAIDVAYGHVGSTYDFDAAVFTRDDSGKTEIVRRHEEQKKHGTREGVVWGLGAGALAALFPGIGIVGGLAAGGGIGGLLGRHAGHARSALSKDDLASLGEVLERGQAGLVVVYSADMADRVATTVTSQHRVTATTTMSAEEIAAKMSEA
jgi:uncharacterized membrane protein